MGWKSWFGKLSKLILAPGLFFSLALLFASSSPAFAAGYTKSMLVLYSSSNNNYTDYFQEILRNEGFNSQDVIELSQATISGKLTPYDLVYVGENSLTTAQVNALTSYVNGGGNLLVSRPDSKLAPLLGLSPTGGTLNDGYLQVDTSKAPGRGIVGQTIQFHGAADLYNLTGATSVATLFSNSVTSTSFPAVTIRNVGSNGGHAAAITFNFPKSIVLMRQGNPAWIGQERDGDLPTRASDMFYPNWIDPAKRLIPQADEEQRLVANLIINMVSNKKVLPRFWYLPWGKKAAVVMTGDDHGHGGTVTRFNNYLAESPANCKVANWECVRATVYLWPYLPLTSLTNALATSYQSQGFEISYHVDTNCNNWTPSSLESAFQTASNFLKTQYPSVVAPVSERTHCFVWNDWSTHVTLDQKYGIRYDTNYGYMPSLGASSVPGYFNGTAMPMRFGALNIGYVMNVYQAPTQMIDNIGQVYPDFINSYLDKAIGPEGYYGVLTALMHLDYPVLSDSDKIVRAAQAHNVPVVTAKQILTWLDGRNYSYIYQPSWSGNSLGFNTVVDSRANGIQAMLPMQSSKGSLRSVSFNGQAINFSSQTVKGISYAVFFAPSGSFNAIYQ